MIILLGKHQFTISSVDDAPTVGGQSFAGAGSGTFDIILTTTLIPSVNRFLHFCEQNFVPVFYLLFNNSPMHISVNRQEPGSAQEWAQQRSHSFASGECREDYQ